MGTSPDRKLHARQAAAERRRAAQRRRRLLRVGGPIAALVVAAVVVALVASGGDDGPPAPGSAAQLAAGAERYATVCADCHGDRLQGTAAGPPFLDPIYLPDHHGDDAFRAAVRQGVQAHHWDFGPMPPQPAVDEDETEAIIAFVRARQRDAGVTRTTAPPTTAPPTTGPATTGP